MVAIDPGERHNGVALWMGAKCYDTFEVPDAEIYPLLFTWLRARALNELVLEEFRLFPWKSKEQAFGQLITVERIGVIKYLCGLAEVPCLEQPASIKKPTFATAKGRGIEILGLNQHMRDAWAHGYYRLVHR